MHRDVRNSPGSLFQVFITQGFHIGHFWEATRPFPKWSLFFFPVFVPFYFIFGFFLKNTLLQELENTQKQIEEHQHDKVNAAIQGPDPVMALPHSQPPDRGHLLLQKCPSLGELGSQSTQQQEATHSPTQ